MHLATPDGLARSNSVPKLTETISAILHAHRTGRQRRPTPWRAATRAFAPTAIRRSSSACATRPPPSPRQRRLMAAGAKDLPLYGIPVAVKDNIDVEGLPTTAACPAFAYTPGQDATAGGAAPPRRRHRHRQDQPRSVRDRPGRHALALWRAAQRVRSETHPRRIELGLGGRGRGGPRAARARHRHRGLGPRAGRAQQHRRPQAEPRARLDRRRRAGLPLARLRLDLRADHRRLLDGARRDRRARRRRSLFARAPARRGRHRRRRRAARRADRRASACSSATAPRPAAYDRRSRARPRSARRSSRSTSSRSTRPRGCSTKGRGSPSATSCRKSLLASSPDSIHPVTREIIVKGARPSAVDAFAAFYKLEELRRVRDVTFQIDRRAAAADRADGLYRRAGAGRSDPAQQPARHLHQLRQPARSVRPRRAGLDAAGRHAVRRHAARAGRPRCAAGLDRPRLPRRHRTAARRARPAAAAARCRLRPRRPRTRSPSPSSARICPACRSTAN